MEGGGASGTSEVFSDQVRCAQFFRAALKGVQVAHLRSVFEIGSEGAAEFSPLSVQHVQGHLGAIECIIVSRDKELSFDATMIISPD